MCRLACSPMPTWKRWSTPITIGSWHGSASASATLWIRASPPATSRLQAAKKALAQRGLAATDIDAIIVGTVTPDMFFPSTACVVQNKLGAKGAWGFDLSAACSAFLYSLQVGAQFIASGAHKRVLVIGARCDVVDH